MRSYFTFIIAFIITFNTMACSHPCSLRFYEYCINFISIVANSNAVRQTVKCRRAEKRRVTLRDANPYFRKQGEAYLMTLSEIANASGVNYPPVMEDQAAKRAHCTASKEHQSWRASTSTSVRFCPQCTRSSPLLALYSYLLGPSIDGIMIEQSNTG
jgi:hypothetical protein